MDKYTYNIKMEKIQKLVRAGDYQTAARVADTVEWEEVRSVRMLTTAASAYEGVGDYKLAIDLLLMAYEESAVGKRILYKLTGLAIADRDIARAEGFYKMYLQEAPEDHGRYLLRYLLAELRNEPADKKIAILETYCRYEPEEDWMYRLAELYHQAGMKDKCIEVCDQIILWFSIGEVVEKAMHLKELYEPLSDKQLDRRENREYYESRYREVVREFEGEDAFRTLSETTYEPEAGDAIGSEYEAEPAYEEEIGYEAGPAYEEETEYEAEPAHEEEIGYEAEPAYEEEAGYETEPLYEESEPHVSFDMFENMSAEAEVSADAEQLNDPENVVLTTAVQESEEPAAAVQEISAPETASVLVRSTLLPVVAESRATGIETAIEALDQFCGMMGLDMPGVSKISAGRFNVRGVAGSFARIRGKAVLVEEANELTDELLRDMSELATREEDRVIFLLLDRASAIAYLQRRLTALGLDGETAEVEETVVAEETAEVEETVVAEENVVAEEAVEVDAMTPVTEPSTELPAGFVLPEENEIPESFAVDSSSEGIFDGESVPEESDDELPMIHIESVREDADMPSQVISHDDDGYLFGVDALFRDEKDDFSFNDLFKMQAAPTPEADASPADATMTAKPETEAEQKEKEQPLPAAKAEMSVGVGLEEAAELEKKNQSLQETPIRHVNKQQRSAEKSFREEPEDIDEFLDAFVKATESFVDSQESEPAAESAVDSRDSQEPAECADDFAKLQMDSVTENTKLGGDVKPDRSDDKNSFGETAGESAALQGELSDDDEMPDENAFIDYIKSYIDAIDCVVDEMGMLAIHRIVDNMQEDGIPLTKKEAEDIIEAAADRAEKKSMGSLFTKRYDREGRLILREKHFD